MDKKLTRREFVKTTSAAAAGIAASSMAMSAKSYARIIGANERMNFAIVGLRSRGYAHLGALVDIPEANISHVCDVDQREIDKFSLKVKEDTGKAPAVEKDIRKLVELKDVDAITIATPEHWHAPMALLGLQGGKHVYLEKPSSHNPKEGEMLVKARKKYKPLIQMGNQQRSSDHTIKIIKRIHEGLIGDVYFAKAWYANRRPGIGVGKKVPVPAQLDWELWQGPAPRRPYKDNIHPYNWHWFWNWGTGESLNNGTHEVDVCRWALNVGFPNRVTASGGRYHFDDDWEFYDTMLTSFEYDDKMITWEGLSCQGKKYYGRGRGSTIHGKNGTVLIDRNGYIVFGPENEVIEEYNTKSQEGSMGTRGGGSMTTAHFQNFINAIKKGEKQHSPIEEGNISVTMLLLTNIAWKMGRSLDLNPKNGHIKKDKKAMKMWGREYEKGWEPKV